MGPPREICHSLATIRDLLFWLIGRRALKDWDGLVSASFPPGLVREGEEASLEGSRKALIKMLSPESHDTLTGPWRVDSELLT